MAGIEGETISARVIVTGMRFVADKRRPRWLRALACLFVCAILADLGFDADCDDPPGAPVSVLSVAPSAGSGSTDACAVGCVPDCYCCSQSIAPDLAALALDAGPIGVPQPERPVKGPAGVRPVPYRPPLHLA